MNIKAQALLNAVQYIEAEYGQAALRDIVRACSPALRDRYTSAIAIDWHPMAEFVELLEVAEKQLATGTGKLAEEIGAAGARANLRGALTRLFFYVAKPDYLMKRIAQLWSRYNDQGAMTLVHIDEFSSVIEVKGVPDPNWLFCCTLTGWAREVVTAAGGEHAHSRHVECRAKGAKRCLWRQSWSGLGASELAKITAPPRQ